VNFYVKKYNNFLVRRIFSVYYRLKRFEKFNIEEYLECCSKNILYYKGKGNKMKNFNIIKKDNIKSNVDNFVNKKIHIKNIGYTSGTTGTPMKYFRDVNSMVAEQFFQCKYFGWKNKYLVVLRGENIFPYSEKVEKIYKKIPFIKEMYVSSYHLNDKSMGRLVEELKRIKNKCLWAYPSTAYLLADFCERNKLDLKFDIVATSSEKLYQYQAEKIEKVFGTTVKDWYGQCERIAAFGRCSCGHYHEIQGYSFIEYEHIRDNIYEIIGTTIHNKVMPLIRFKTGDYVEISKENCECGIEGTNIKTIHGRNSDFLDVPGGKIPGGLLNYAFKKVINIKEAQVVQQKDKTIVIKIVKNKIFSGEDEKHLKNELFEFLPKECCKFEYVDKIDREKSGKHRLVINEGA
jgi:phenylacetate-CoA ligase